MRLLIATYFFMLLCCQQLIGQTTLAEESFEMDGITEVEIKGAFCDVKVEGYGSGATLYFDGAINGLSGKSYSIEFDRSGSMLQIWVESPRSNWGSVDCNLNLKLAKTTNVTVDNSSGDVFVSDLSGKSLRFEASSGDLEIRNISADLRLETSSGDIELENLTGELQSRSSSGDQDLSKINGDIESYSSSGTIELQDIVGDIMAETSSGGISLDDVKGGLKLESTSGSLRGDDVELTADAYFKSSSGSIDMDLVNEIESLDFDLKASSGSLRVGSRRAEDRLIDKRSGGYEITGISSSGSQRYDN